jgi:surface carbohydrate biosynthesis protein
MSTNGATRPFLYLPIEVASRELHAKLLLTYFAVEMGFEVVIGWKRMMNKNLRYMPPGVVMFKTLTVNDAAAMQEAKGAGHGVAAIDEEVPGLVTMKQKLRWVTEESVTSSDLIFALGEEHREALLHFRPAHGDKYHVVGNPRWDLLRPELRGSYDEEVAAIRAQHAPFILINTNFAALNSARLTAEKMPKRFVKTGVVDLRKPEDVIFLDEIFQMERANTEAIRALLRELPVRFPNHRFIVRPHPIERTEPWSDFLRDIPRATMIREGAAVPATCSSIPIAPPASRLSRSTSRRSRCNRPSCRFTRSFLQTVSTTSRPPSARRSPNSIGSSALAPPGPAIR